MSVVSEKRFFLAKVTLVKVSDTPGAGNTHFLHLKTIANRMMVAHMRCMRTIYSSQNLMETTVKMDEKLGGKTQKKFLHKLYKQQIE